MTSWNRTYIWREENSKRTDVTLLARAKRVLSRKFQISETNKGNSSSIKIAVELIKFW